MSLIESCVAIAIASVLLMIAIPAFVHSQDDYVLMSVARDVASRMQLARIHAISRNIDCRLRVTSTVTYAVECQDPDWIAISSIMLPRDFTISSNARPEFHRLGNVAPAATITVLNKTGHAKRVVVNNGGRVRID